MWIGKDTPQKRELGNRLSTSMEHQILSPTSIIATRYALRQRISLAGARDLGRAYCNESRTEKKGRASVTARLFNSGPYLDVRQLATFILLTIKSINTCQFNLNFAARDFQFLQ